MPAEQQELDIRRPRYQMRGAFDDPDRGEAACDDHDGRLLSALWLDGEPVADSIAEWRGAGCCQDRPPSRLR